MRKTKTVYAGIAAVLVFWFTTLICGVILGDYDHLSRMVSELGAVGTNTQTLFTAGLVLCGLLSIIFVVELIKRCRDMDLSVIPVIVILTFSFSIIGAGLFPMPLPLHGRLGLPSLLLITSPLLSLVLWRKNWNPPHLKWMAAISLILMLLGFMVYFPDLFGDLMGLKQRVFHAGWSVWFIYLSLFWKRNEGENQLAI